MKNAPFRRRRLCVIANKAGNSMLALLASETVQKRQHSRGLAMKTPRSGGGECVFLLLIPY